MNSSSSSSGIITRRILAPSCSVRFSLTNFTRRNSIKPKRSLGPAQQRHDSSFIRSIANSARSTLGQGQNVTSKSPHLIPQQSQQRMRAYRRFLSSYADPQFQNPTFEQPKRSLPARILLGTIKWAVAGGFFFFLGQYVTIMLLPPVSKEIAFSMLQEKPTNEQTLTLYTPADERAASINTHIITHALAEELRKDDRYIEARPHMKIPEAVRKMNLTGGTLAGRGCLEVPPLCFSDKEGTDFVSIFYLGENLCGHPGLIHGGMLATLLDEGLARCCFPALPNKIAVTANIKVDYRRPVKAGNFYVLRATTQRVEGRKAIAKGWIEQLDELSEDDVKAGKHPTKLVEAEALYIEPKNAAILRKAYGDAT